MSREACKGNYRQIVRQVAEWRLTRESELEQQRAFATPSESGEFVHAYDAALTAPRPCWTARRWPVLQC